uniref:MADF domain-containing protein n=1 Tax=Timema poppense TaxID=170557 RepID=A0A7R9DKX7_TIMPO|nr:unnamed protein product [Timema poppensis]
MTRQQCSLCSPAGIHVDGYYLSTAGITRQQCSLCSPAGIHVDGYYLSTAGVTRQQCSLCSPAGRHVDGYSLSTAGITRQQCSLCSPAGRHVDGYYLSTAGIHVDGYYLPTAGVTRQQCSLCSPARRHVDGYYLSTAGITRQQCSLCSPAGIHVDGYYLSTAGPAACSAALLARPGDSCLRVVMTSRFQCNSEQLIGEVRKYPALYDPSHPKYSDKAAKNKYWKKVAEVTITGWAGFSPLEQTMREKDLYRRWKSLRDCFRRELSIQAKEERFNTTDSRRKTYMYYDNMLFLLPIMGQTRAKKDSDEEERKPDVTDEVEEEPREKHPRRRYKGLSRVSRRPSVLDEDPLVEVQMCSVPQIVAPAEEEAPNDDDDKAFLMSLLPTLRRFDERDKLTVRIEIMNTLRKCQLEFADTKLLS